MRDRLMLFNKGIKIIAIVLSVMFFLYLVASIFLGPGASDYLIEIKGNYSYEDAGHFEKHIIFLDDKKKPSKIVIDSRVDDYIIDGDFIYVARRPVEYYKDGNIMKSNILNTCEYWRISTIDNTIQKTQPLPSLKCK